MRKVGFLGMGIMGRAMAANLVRAGFQVKVWNRTAEGCDPLVQLGADKASSVQDVVRSSEVTIAMLADPAASRDVALGPDGVVACLQPGQAYVDMSTVDPETARTVSEAVNRVGGRFLEAPVSGSRRPAEEGTLVILAAGDGELYREMQPVFEVLGKKNLYFGEVGQAAAVKLIVNMTMGGMMGLLAEALALGQECGINGQTLLDVLDAGAVANPMFRMKGPRILADEHDAHFPLKHMQKDLRLAIDLGDRQKQPLPTVASVNESFKRAMAAGLGDCDFAAVARVLRAREGGGT